ncbi:hypothetical protein LCGC14_1837910 [marine sediment metagenome]|uniref:Terminase large subunit gp17-like C-terminal domain-containing protein n=1 Tax=marine sediment metagenome TaxID=412755 RepID=A0A0F9GE99_9ZZZZ
MVACTDDNRLTWISRNLQITDKEGTPTLLVPNNGQLLFHSHIQQQRSRGVPVKIVLLKPRRVGWTTWAQAESYHDVYHTPNRTGFVASLDSDSTDYVFRMVQRFDANVRPRRPAAATNKKEIIYEDPHGSQVYAQTAGKIGLGRSFNAHYLLCDEVAFWPNAKSQLGSLTPIVPETDPNTSILIVSTANGLGGEFYDRYWLAKSGDPSDFERFRSVFFPWYAFPEYQHIPRPDFVVTDEEADLVALYNLTDGQLTWRRRQIDRFKGDLGLFKQEFPATDIEAFQASGNNVFTPTQIASQKRHVTDCRTIVFTGPDGDFEDVHRQVNCWHVARMPIARRQYTLGVDTMEGRLSDVKDLKSKLDFDGMVIMDRMTGEVVAVWHGQGSQDDLAEQAYWAALFYLEAFTGIEMPKGFTVLKYFVSKGYTKLYNRETHDESLAPLQSENYGWRTTLITREWMVKDFITAIRDLAITIYQGIVIDEMETFIKDKTGKCIHMPGKKDDLLFGLMIAIQVHKRCPLTLGSDQTHTSGEAEKPRKTIASLAYSGAIDPGNEYDDDDDYYDGHTY